MTTREDKYRIPLFEGNNFDDWKFRMEVYLEDLDLLDFAEVKFSDKDEVKLSENETAETREQKEKLFENWRKRDRKCKSEIVQRISDEYLEYVKGKPTAYDMWSTLQKVFARKGIANQLYLRKNLLLMKFDPSEETMVKYFLRFDKLIRDLRLAGATLVELDIVCHLLLTMPPEYDVVVTAIETLSEDKLTVEFVKSRLLDEERKRESADTLGKDISSHSLGACAGEKVSNFVAAANNKQKSVFCYFCGKQGHKKPQCLKLKRKANQQTNKNAYVADATDENNSDYSLMVLEGIPFDFVDFDNTIQWYLDSGASDHMVSSILRDNLVNIRKLDCPIKIKVAKSNEILKAYEIGDFQLAYKDNFRNNRVTLTDVLIVSGLQFNLLSVRRLDSKGFKVIFENGTASAMKKNKVIFIANRVNKMYLLKLELNNACTNVASSSNTEIWHKRLGHTGMHSLKQLPNIVEGLDINGRLFDLPLQCEYCVEGKLTHFPHVQRRTRAK